MCIEDPKEEFPSQETSQCVDRAIGGLVCSLVGSDCLVWVLAVPFPAV